MNNDERVCCVDCMHFRLCDEGLPYCFYENECDINDFEDSKAFKYRPKYEEE